jgi:hypothetical protein
MLNRMKASAERMAEGDLSIMAAEESQSVFDAVLAILRRGMATPSGSA